MLNHNIPLHVLINPFSTAFLPVGIDAISFSLFLQEEQGFVFRCAILHICTPACIYACLPAYMQTACMHACVPESHKSRPAHMTCLHMCTPACIYGCLPACMHAYRHICMPVRMNACPPGWHKSRPAYRNCLHLCMPACIYACLPAHMHACLHNAFLPGSKKASLLIGTTCIYTCMPACMHACLHICMHACIYACLPGWHKSRHACMNCHYIYDRVGSQQTQTSTYM